MQTKKKYSDRRRNRRRDRRRDPAFDPDQDKRHGDRRCNPRRRNVRLNVSFEILLSDKNGKTINASASGVYFEVAIKDMEAFSPGASIPLQITTVTNTPEYQERKLKLGARGTVIRNCIIENPDYENSLGVALEFTGEFNIVEESDSLSRVSSPPQITYHPPHGSSGRPVISL
jgi:hypothetical protein